jgi:hypothetical protein
MSANQPSEDELRAAYEEQIRQLRVEHVLLDNVVMLINLGMRRTGLVEGTADERDIGQVQMAIESVRAVMPVLEAAAPEQARQIRQALSQLQLAYVQIGGSAGGETAGSPASGAAASEAGPTAPAGASGPGAGAGTSPPEPASQQPPATKPGEPGPAQRSGRLWIPGQ